MALTITTKTNAGDVQHIYKKSQTIPQLTPRSLKQLQKLSTKNLIATARENHQIIGWLISEPLSKNVFEIGLGFVEKPHRGQNLLYQMAKILTANPSATYIFATYENFILQNLQKLNFQTSTLLQVALISHGKFITKRLANPAATKRVASHLSQSQALYGIKKAEKS